MGESKRIKRWTFLGSSGQRHVLFVENVARVYFALYGTFNSALTTEEMTDAIGNKA